MIKLKFEVLVFEPKERKYITYVFDSQDSVKSFISRNREAINEYDIAIVSISRYEFLDLEDFGL